MEAVERLHVAEVAVGETDVGGDEVVVLFRGTLGDAAEQRREEEGAAAVEDENKWWQQ